MSDPHPFLADFDLAQRCLAGETGAIRRFQRSYRPVLIAYLRQAGAELDEAEEVTESLWSDCLAEREDKGPRLAMYDGRASLKTWLRPVALNRLIERKRRRQLWNELLADGFDAERIDREGVRPAAVVAEAPLLELMREALEAGFQACAAEDFVLLQLAHLDRLRLFELARMFGCSKSKIDRDLERAKKIVAEATLQHVRTVDPWLELQWDDFVELCRAASPACLGMD